MAVSILRRISARFRRSTPSTDAGGKGLDEAAARLQELRGDKISTTAPLDAPNSSDNIAAAAKDFGMGAFSGGTEAIGGASGGYRSSRDG